MMFVLFLSLCFICISNSVPVPSVLLKNAALPGVRMPIIGLGTGTYGEPDGTDGEYWTDEMAETAALTWLQLGGRRIDGSYGYPGQAGIGAAIKKSNISREEIFITSKVDPKGYKVTMDQFAEIQKTLQLDYVDLLLIHFPGTWSTADPNFACAHVNGTINWKPCRQDTWKALEDIFRSKKARAIGVSNFEINHLDDILDLKGLLPAVNQNEHHLYFHEDLLVDFCVKHNILFNTYSPLGAPDFMAFQPENFGIPLMNNPSVVAIANKYMKTAAQVLLRWAVQQDLVVNPRSMNPAHMKDNLDLFSFSLTHLEMAELSFMQKPAYKVVDDPRIIP